MLSDNETDTEIDDQKHAKLLENVQNLSSRQYVKKATRSEPTSEVSEFNLVKSATGGKGSVRVGELTKALKNRSNQVRLRKKIKNSEQKTLRKPLEKPQAERIRRSVAYASIKKQLDRWEPIVTSNRASDSLSFPLEINTEICKNEVTEWRLKSDLEKEIEKLEPKVETFEIEDESKFPLTMEEMMEKRREAAKLRRYQNYKEIKARRQNKIKSKKYRKVLRREKVKRQMKEFEELQKTDPEGALRKLDEIEKARAEERVTLRHKSTGKWAKSLQVRAKYDKESRQTLAQQLAISRELTQKLKPDENSDSELEEEPQQLEIEINGAESDVKNIKPTTEVEEFVTGYRKFWEQSNKNKQENKECKKEETLKETETNIKDNSKIVNKQKKVSRKRQGTSNDTLIKPKYDLTSTSSDWKISTLNGDSETLIDDIFDNLEYKLKDKLQREIKSVCKGTKASKISKKNESKKKSDKKNYLSLPLKSNRVIIDQELNERSDVSENVEKNQEFSTLKSIIKSKEIKSKDTGDIDPNKFMNLKPAVLDTDIPDVLTVDENESHDQRGVISEAFEDDDIVEDFAKEKRDEIEKDNPKDIDLSLPGWGCWGGKNVKMSAVRRKRFILKVPKDLPRKDKNKADLVINENACKKIKPHLVSDLPFPFKSVKDYEASIRAPLGNTFVPETAFRKLTKPAMTTKLGTIIEPMTEDVLLKKKKCK